MSSPSRGGRPVEPVSQDVADALFDWLYEGGSLLAFCRQPGMPSVSAVHRWRQKDAAFAAAFADARRAGADVLPEMAQEVADDSSQDYVEVTTRDGHTRQVFNAEHVQRSKLRIDQLNRRAACYDPARYGTKVALGGDASAPPIKVEPPCGPPIPPTVDLLRDLRIAAKLAEEVLGPELVRELEEDAPADAPGVAPPRIPATRPVPARKR